ncbi:MAG: hypothetical protein WCK23_05825 [Actinomycetes bacterium]
MSRLACDPQRLADLARILRSAQNEIELNIRLTKIGDLAIPQVHSYLQQSLNLLKHQEARVRKVLNSSFLNLTNSYSLSFNSTAYLLNRWVAHHEAWWSDATHGEQTRIDILISTVAADPIDAGKLIDSTSFLAPLIYGSHDLGMVRTLWLSATDPQTTSASTAGDRIKRLVETIFGDQKWHTAIAPSWVDIHEQSRLRREIREILGEIISPWQLQFSGLASEWNWSSETGVHYLKKATESADAASSISQGLGMAVYRNMSDLPDKEIERRQRIDAVAFSVGVSTELLRQAKVQQAQIDSHHLATLLAIPTLLPLNLPWPSSLLINKAHSLVAGQLDTTSETNISSSIEMLQQRSALASVAYMAVFNAAITSGRLENANDDPSAELRLELQHTVDSIDSSTTRGQILADIID